MIVTCAYCGKQFERKLSHAKRVKHQLCSRACQTNFKPLLAIEELEAVIGCNLKEWLFTKYVTERMSTREISTLLYGVPTNSPNVLHYLHEYDIPLRHGSEAIKTQWEGNEERKRATGERAKQVLHCESSRERRRETMNTPEYRKRASEAKLGEKNPMWNSQITAEERAELEASRKSSKAATWKKWVYERDGHTCQKCGRRDGSLNAHHLFNFKDHPDKRYDVSNGITLCENCHIKFHQTYGYRNNTVEQILEYLE